MSKELINWLRDVCIDERGDEAADMIASLQEANEQLQRENERNQLDNASLANRLTAAKKLIEFLWQIIDDIDTYGDMAKSDDKAFRAMVERRQKDRWKTGITTDGYTLDINEALRDEVTK